MAGAGASDAAPVTSHGHQEAIVNRDVLEGKWTQVRGQMRQWWGKLTDDDLDVIAGKRDRLVGTLQERYGWAKDAAEAEIERRLKALDGTAPYDRDPVATEPRRR